MPKSMEKNPFSSLSVVNSGRWLLVALLYFLCGMASVRTVWLPCGLSLAAFLLVERRKWPVLFLAIITGETLYNYVAGYTSWPWWATWSVTLANIISAIVGATICHRFLGGRALLDSISKLVVIVIFGAMIPLLAPATVGAIASQMAGSKRDFLTIWNGWYIRDVLGVLLITPLVLSWSQPVGKLDRYWGKKQQLEAFSLLACAICLIIAGSLVEESRFGIVRLAAIPILLWSSLRFGVRGASAYTLLMALSWGWLNMRVPSSGTRDMLAISIRNLDMQCTVASMAFIGLIPAIITQVQRRAEELLVSERNFFRSSLDQAPEGIIVLGLDGELLDINQSGLKLLHFPSVEEARSVGIESRLSHLARTEHMKMLGIVRSGAEHLHDFLIENSNKPRRQIESRAVALRHPNGDIYATLSIWRDVTDERRFNSELKVARFTVDHATVPLLWISRQGRVVDTNQSACLLLGYPRGELLVLQSKDLSTDFSETRWNKLWSEIAEKRTADFEATLRHKSGRSINAELRSHYIDLDLGGEHRELICVFLTDVTEKRRAIELIRRNEERLALIFGAVAEGIVVYDGNEKIIEANPSAWQILGGTTSGNLEKLQQKLVWQFLDEPTQETDQEVDPLSFTFRTGKPTRGLLRILARDDGSLRCLSVSTQPLLNNKGTVELVISSFSDITAQRSMQEQLRRSQKMVIFGQLAGGIAHDFNNILTAMGFSLNLLDETISSESEEGHLISNLRSMTKRASGLTEQLLLFARHRVVQMKKIDLNANVTALMKILMPALGERINLSMKLHPRPIWIEGDSGMIDQVIMNLCVNARDAIGSMGTITISTEVGTLPQGFDLKTRMGSPTIGPFALLRISDTGCGMSEKILERIFEPFYTTKETGKGTGLGLATVHGILEQHHAWATVESTVGKGTVFSVYIALSDDPHKKLEPEKPNFSGEGQTILLVEDEELVRMLCSTLLENAGYKVLAARDGSEAIRVWNSNRDAIKILVTDMVLPGGITGLELIEKLRQQSPELCAVLVSGYNEEVLKTEEFSEIGITLLPKPFEISSLTQAISTKLRNQACPIDANILIR